MKIPRRSTRGFLDLDLAGLIALVPKEARPWVAGTLLLCSLGVLSYQVHAISTDLASYQAKQGAQTEKFDRTLDAIGDKLAQIPPLASRVTTVETVAEGAAKDAARANTRLDGAEADPAFDRRRRTP